jgi:lambda family phage portal protein
MYAAARNTRQTLGFGASGNSSADAELHLSLPMMRARSRQMVRDSSYAKRAKNIVVGNVIGTGVGMQAQVGTNRAGLNERVNTDIEEAFTRWAAADSCHTGGKLHFHDIERAAFGQIFETGEVLVRMHLRPFGDSRVPMALELIEAERLADHIAPPGAVSTDGDVRMGVEVDEFQRPIAYWIRTIHPGDVRMKVGAVDRYERVPADQIFHLYIVDRWPQTRGEPWLHTALRKIDELNEYTGLEVSAARGSAAYFATITTPEPESALVDSEEDDGKQVMDLEPLTIQELAPGEELQFHAPNRPNSALDPFMRAMLREIAAGTGVSYESLSRDYSQSNYSSSRLALIDDRELYRTLQQWWIRAFRAPLHKVWLQQAVLARAIESVPAGSYAMDPSKFEVARFKPRGWSWIDPTKEVAAYKEAIKAGLTTASDVVAATSGGLDIEDIVKTRRRELDMFKQAGIATDTDVAAEREAAKPAPAPGPKPEPEEEVGEGDAPDAAKRHQPRVVPLARTA